MVHSNSPKPIAVITGASKGIGLAIAHAFVAENYSVLLCSRSEAHLEEASREIRRANPEADIKTYAADMGDAKQVKDFGNWCLQQGTPTILVNNAGIYLPGNLSDAGEGNMEDTMNINFYSAYHLTRELLPAMKEQGHGHIFNISSIAGLGAYDGGGAYSVSKFALTGFSKNLRHELKATGIKVTTVFPGAVMTNSWAGFDNSNNRIMEASDIAAMLVSASKLSAAATVEEIVIRPQLGDL
ncbi:MAG: SDR family oxidoreductase [Chitinophagaceae bacterium]|nr:MAG: SDR family oxidoreductase [Chitinophagaceae bacterium]